MTNTITCYAYGTAQECNDCTKQGAYNPCPKTTDQDRYPEVTEQDYQRFIELEQYQEEPVVDDRQCQSYEDVDVPEQDPRCLGCKYHGFSNDDGCCYCAYPWFK